MAHGATNGVKMSFFEMDKKCSRRFLRLDRKRGVVNISPSEGSNSLLALTDMETRWGCPVSLHFPDTRCLPLPRLLNCTRIISCKFIRAKCQAGTRGGVEWMENSELFETANVTGFKEK